MVAKINTGQNLDGAVLYNERKVSAGKAVCLSADNYPVSAEKLSNKEKYQYLQFVASRNTRSQTNCVHISLNFSPEDVLDQDKMMDIARDYLQRIGFDEQPALVYQHFDAAHPHVHIVTTNIRFNGRAIPLHNLGKNKSEPARKALEEAYHLIRAEGRGRTGEGLQPIDPEKLEYGREPTKAAISNILRSVIPNYKYTNLQELNAVLYHFNVMADPGPPGTQWNARGGLKYSILDKQGQKTGVAIAASDFFQKPTLKMVRERFGSNEKKRAPYKERIRLLLDKSLSKPVNNCWELLQSDLSKVGISLVLTRSKDLLVTDAVFVDHRTRAVYSARDLGPDYSVANLYNSILEKQHQDPAEVYRNKAYLHRSLATIDFNLPPATIFQLLAGKGIVVLATYDRSGSLRYKAGHVLTRSENFQALAGNPVAFFTAIGWSPESSYAYFRFVREHYPIRGLSIDTKADDPISQALERHAGILLNIGSSFFSLLEKLLEGWLKVERGSVGGFYLPGAKKKKRR